MSEGSPSQLYSRAFGEFLVRVHVLTARSQKKIYLFSPFNSRRLDWMMERVGFADDIVETLTLNVVKEL